MVKKGNDYMDNEEIIQMSDEELLYTVDNILVFFNYETSVPIIKKIYYLNKIFHQTQEEVERNRRLIETGCSDVEKLKDAKDILAADLIELKELETYISLMEEYDKKQQSKIGKSFWSIFHK